MSCLIISIKKQMKPRQLCLILVPDAITTEIYAKCPILYANGKLQCNFFLIQLTQMDIYQMPNLVFTYKYIYLRYHCFDITSHFYLFLYGKQTMDM